MLLEINCIKNYLTYDFLTNCIEVAWYILMLSYCKKVEATTASTRLTTFFALFICFILNDILQSICFWIFSSKLWITFENKYLLVHTWRIHAVQKRYLWRISLASIMLWYYHNTNRNNFAPHKKWSKAIWEYFWKNAYNMKQNKKAEKDNIFQWKFYFFICPIKMTFFSTILVILDIAETVIVFPVVDTMSRVPGLLKLLRFDFMWIFHSGTFRRMCRQVIAKH